MLSVNNRKKNYTHLCSKALISDANLRKLSFLRIWTIWVSVMSHWFWRKYFRQLFLSLSSTFQRSRRHAVLWLSHAFFFIPWLSSSKRVNKPPQLWLPRVMTWNACCPWCKQTIKSTVEVGWIRSLSFSKFVTTTPESHCQNMKSRRKIP